jgi:hypothetical protein
MIVILLITNVFIALGEASEKVYLFCCDLAECIKESIGAVYLGGLIIEILYICARKQGIL